MLLIVITLYGTTCRINSRTGTEMAPTTIMGRASAAFSPCSFRLGAGRTARRSTIAIRPTVPVAIGAAVITRPVVRDVVTSALATAWGAMIIGDTANRVTATEDVAAKLFTGDAMAGCRMALPEAAAIQSLGMSTPVLATVDRDRALTVSDGPVKTLFWVSIPLDEPTAAIGWVSRGADRPVNRAMKEDGAAMGVTAPYFIVAITTAGDRTPGAGVITPVLAAVLEVAAPATVADPSTIPVRLLKIAIVDESAPSGPAGAIRRFEAIDCGDGAKDMRSTTILRPVKRPDTEGEPRGAVGARRAGAPVETGDGAWTTATLTILAPLTTDRAERVARKVVLISPARLVTSNVAVP
jgi:hypothetical protein